MPFFGFISHFLIPKSKNNGVCNRGYCLAHLIKNVFWKLRVLIASVLQVRFIVCWFLNGWLYKVVSGVNTVLRGCIDVIFYINM